MSIFSKMDWGHLEQFGEASSWKAWIFVISWWDLTKRAILVMDLPSRKTITYLTMGKGNSSSRVPWQGICYFPAGYHFCLKKLLVRRFVFQESTEIQRTKNKKHHISWSVVVSEHPKNINWWFLGICVLSEVSWLFGLFVCLFVCLLVGWLVGWSVGSLVCRFVGLFVCLFVCLLACLLACLFVCLFVCVFEVFFGLVCYRFPV